LSDGRISGRVELRPIRLGLVVAPGSADSLDRAIRVASVCWGGRTFPIFNGDEDQARVRRLAILLGVDALVACDDDARSHDLAAMDGFSWMGYRNPVDFAEYGDRLVDVATVLSSVQGGTRREDVPTLVTWATSDDLDLLRAVLYGRIGDKSSYERSIQSALSQSLPTAHLEPDALGATTESVYMGPLALGMWAVLHRSVHRDSGIAVIDPFSPRDLTILWNLRATGTVVLPWPVPHDERLAAFTHGRLPALPRTSWGQEGEEFTTIFTADRDIPSELRELLEADRRGRVHISSPDLEEQAHLGSAIGTAFANYFEVRTDRDTRQGLTARVPLPRTGMTRELDIQHGLQYAAARVEIDSERDLGERLSFRAPAVRQLAKELRWAVSVNSPVVRGVGEGVVVGCTINGDHDLAIGALDSIGLIGRLLLAAGFQVKVSDAGRWTSRIVDMLGGADSTLAAQPSIREVLDLASREGGANAEELHNAARRSSGRWEKRAVLWLRTTPYHRWVVGVLAAQRLIESHLTYTCGACGLLQRLAPEQIQPTLTCNDCENETPLSLQVVLGARWRLKTRRLLTTKRLRSALPVAASLSLLGQLQRRGDSANLHYSLGLDLERDSMKFEIDYAVLLQDERGPALIVGESKARNDLDNDDVSNLEIVQEAVRALGVECFIAISNSKSSLSPSEVARLRQSAERFLYRLNEGRGRGGFVNLPLVLTRNALTAPEMDDAHPLTIIGHHRSAVDELARWSAERELGLDGYGEPVTRTLSWTTASEPGSGPGSDRSE
jgi:hypothetical protein